MIRRLFRRNAYKPTAEELIVDEIGKNTHNGLADRFLARLAAVKAYYADPSNYQMPSEAHYDGVFLGRKAAFRFAPTSEGDRLTIIAGPYTVRAVNSGQGYVCQISPSEEPSALAA